MRLGTLQYDTARAKETGHTGPSFVNIDQPIVQGGKTVLEAGTRLRIGTGDIFDSDGKRIGKFTQNADFTQG